MPYGPPRDPRDLAFLSERGIDVARVSRSFFAYPFDWKCPVCDASKHELIQRRRNGTWFSNIEKHHFGPVLPNGDELAYLRGNATVEICYLCNGTERDMRKAGLAFALMSAEAMRTSSEFARRRKLKTIRDTHKTRDPKGRWNPDGTSALGSRRR